MKEMLFIGGTGLISSACVARAVEVGHRVSILNRGLTTRSVPKEVKVLKGDARDPETLAEAVQARNFDVVVDFIGFTPEHVRLDIAVLKDRTGQFVFISSASAYQKPVGRLPIREATPLRNPFWQYSRDKIACEDLLVAAYRDQGFPATIVRPSHTYDQTVVPLMAGWTTLARMRQHKPVVIHGDGTSLWVLTHHTDFARAFVPLLGRSQAIGESFHITSDEVLTWNQIYDILGRAAGVEPHLVHVASDTIAKLAPEWGASLLGDAAHSVIFDNTNIRRMVPDWVAGIPFSQGAEEIIDWHDADPARQAFDQKADNLIDELIALV